MPNQKKKSDDLPFVEVISLNEVYVCRQSTSSIGPLYLKEPSDLVIRQCDQEGDSAVAQERPVSSLLPNISLIVIYFLNWGDSLWGLEYMDSAIGMASLVYYGNK